MEEFWNKDELAERLSEEMEQDARRYPGNFGEGMGSV